MSQLFSNNIDTTLAATLSDVATSATLTDGSKLKSPSGGTFELLTLIAAGVVEVVKVTARSGNTVTITRAQEGTTAQAWGIGTRVFAGVTAGTLAALIQNNSAFSEALALGSGASADGYAAVALGSGPSANFEEAAALGRWSNALANYATALGRWTNAYDQHSLAAGSGASATGVSSVAVGRSANTNGAGSLAVGLDSYTEAASALAIGESTYSGGIGSVALGFDADVDFDAVGGIALGGSSVITSRTMQAAAVPAVPRANGIEADAAWKQAGSASIICSAVLDLKTLQTYTITLPTGVTFFPEEVGIIITAASGVTLQPSVRFGATADEARYLAITQTAADAVHGRDRYTTLASAAGSSTLRAEVTTAATGTTLSGRVYWRGFAVVNAA